MLAELVRPVVCTGAGLAVAGALHAAVNRRDLRHLGVRAASVRERVSVLVPARDEAATIGACVAALRRQTDLPDLEVVVLDDHSGDGTAARAEQAAAGDPRVRVVSSTAEPPSGWLGKPHACDRLAALATGSVLVFVDADVRLGPPAVAAAVAALRDGPGADLVSAWPRQVAAMPLARLVQPLQQWSWLTTLPLAVARTSPRPALTAANGQFLVVDTLAYRAAGGHAAVRGAVLDDIALARAAKRAGLRVDVVDAAQVAECEMYRTEAELIDGYAKSLWTAFGGSGCGLGMAAVLAAVFTAPPVYALLGRHRPTRLAGGIGYAAGVAGRVLAARATGGRAWPDALAHPVSITAFSALMVTSVSRRRSGRLSWRGRPVVVPA